MVTVKEAYRKMIESFKENGIEFPKLDSRVLIENALEIERGKLPVYYDRELTEKEEEALKDYSKKRISKMPVSYITNIKEFYGIDFYVCEGVLIPRCDTEILVEEAIARIKPNMKIADLCSGSGCIGLTIAKYCPDSKVELFDISEVATEVTKKNIKRLGLENATVRKLDILKDELPEKYDIIVSNPPYIPFSDIAELERDVKDYEPASALTDGGDGLSFYKRLKYLCEKYCKGYGIFEIGINQLESMKEIFGEIEHKNDLNGIARAVIVRADDIRRMISLSF